MENKRERKRRKIKNRRGKERIILLVSFSCSFSHFDLIFFIFFNLISLQFNFSLLLKGRRLQALQEVPKGH
jgi:hypothetical protein